MNIVTSDDTRLLYYDVTTKSLGLWKRGYSRSCQKIKISKEDNSSCDFQIEWNCAENWTHRSQSQLSGIHSVIKSLKNLQSYLRMKSWFFITKMHQFTVQKRRLFDHYKIKTAWISSLQSWPCYKWKGFSSDKNLIRAWNNKYAIIINK